MNRSLTNVLFGGIAAPAESDYKIEGQITKTTIDDTVDALTNAESVIIVGLLMLQNYSPFLTSS
jgi:NAD(P) transhydrogenase